MAYRVEQRGGTIVELPIEFVDRERGASKMSSRIIVEALLLVTWWGVRDRPRRLLRRSPPVARPPPAATGSHPLRLIPARRPLCQRGPWISRSSTSTWTRSTFCAPIRLPGPRADALVRGCDRLTVNDRKCPGCTTTCVQPWCGPRGGPPDAPGSRRSAITSPRSHARPRRRLLLGELRLSVHRPAGKAGTMPGRTTATPGAQAACGSHRQTRWCSSSRARRNWPWALSVAIVTPVRHSCCHRSGAASDASLGPQVVALEPVPKRAASRATDCSVSASRKVTADAREAPHVEPSGSISGSGSGTRLTSLQPPGAASPSRTSTSCPFRAVICGGSVVYTRASRRPVSASLDSGIQRRHNPDRSNENLPLPSAWLPLVEPEQHKAQLRRLRRPHQTRLAANRHRRQRPSPGRHTTRSCRASGRPGEVGGGPEGRNWCGVALPGELSPGPDGSRSRCRPLRSSTDSTGCGPSMRSPGRRTSNSR